MVTGAQIRMARGFLRWSAKELAESAGVAESTIKRMEQDDGFPIARGANIEAVYKALMSAGIVFLSEDNGDGPGIRLRKGIASGAAPAASSAKRPALRPARTQEAPRKSSRPKRR
jgi:transcriptional regulator with XRE-family HTH domain